MPAEAPTDADLRRAVEDVLPEAVAIYLYGSAADGQSRPGSDVDLAVLAQAPIPAERLAGAREDLAERLRRDVDVVDLFCASTVMRAQVVSAGRLLRDNDPSFREHFETTAYSMYARLNEERRGILERIREEGRIHGR